MQKLTFRGFLKRYVSELATTPTTAIYPLAHDVLNGNYRLREPLFLYAFMNEQLHVLLAATKRSNLYSYYLELASVCKDTEQTVSLLAETTDKLPYTCYKVWKSYQSVLDKPERDDQVKALIRDKVVAVKQNKNISTYRLCKDMNLNNANVNAWLKNGLGNKVSLDTARGVLQYLEGF